MKIYRQPLPSVHESSNTMQRALDHRVGQLRMAKRGKRSPVIGLPWPFLLIVAACMGLLSSGWAGTPYLPATGPAPLRFLALIKPKGRTVLPTACVVAKAAVPQSTNSTEKTPGPPFKQAEAASANLQTNELLLVPGFDPFISPQMLLKYFRNSTNGSAGSAGSPVDFVPPPVAGAPATNTQNSVPAQ